MFINGDVTLFYIVYHNLDNYNVCTTVVGHNGEKWCYGITIPKLLKNIITILHKLQDNIVAKSSIVKKRFQNLFQVNSFSRKIIFFWLHINSILITIDCKSVSWLFLEITTYLFYNSNMSSIMSMNNDPHTSWQSGFIFSH